MREYKGTIYGKRITFYLSEKQMWELVNHRFNLHSNHWEMKKDCMVTAKGCPLCTQHFLCGLCPFDAMCMAVLYRVSPLVYYIVQDGGFTLNKNGSIPKRVLAAFKKVQDRLLAGKKVARRPKEA